MLVPLPARSRWRRSVPGVIRHIRHRCWFVRGAHTWHARGLMDMRCARFASRIVLARIVRVTGAIPVVPTVTTMHSVAEQVHGDEGDAHCNPNPVAL